MMSYVMMANQFEPQPFVPRSWSQATSVLRPRRRERPQQSDEFHKLMSLEYPHDQLSQDRYEFASYGLRGHHIR